LIYLAISFVFELSIFGIRILFCCVVNVVVASFESRIDTKTRNYKLGRRI
jgi:hypothetical protein